MKRLRILFAADVVPDRVLGGAERVLKEHTVRLSRRGHQVHVLARERGGQGIREEVRDGVKISSFSPHPSAPLFALSSIVGARRLFKRLFLKEGFDLLNLHQPFSAVGVLTSRERKKLPTVYTFHSPAFLEFQIRNAKGGNRPLVRLLAFLYRRIEQFCLKRASRIVVLSRFSQTLLERHFGIGEEKVVIIPGGVDLGRFAPKEERGLLKTQLGFSPKTVLLVTIRNLVPRMGLDHLLVAMKIVLKTREDVVLIIGGEGPMANDLKGLAERLGLGPSVRFEGYIPEEKLPSYYQAADFFVLPTTALEGFGLVAVEALACGTPVLGTPVGAIPEVLGPLQEDLLFEGTDPQAMARGILAHLEKAQADPQGYEALRRRCRTYASARFGWETIIDRLEQALVTVARSR